MELTIYETCNGKNNNEIKEYTIININNKREIKYSARIRKKCNELVDKYNDDYNLFYKIYTKIICFTNKVDKLYGTSYTYTMPIEDLYKILLRQDKKCIFCKRELGINNLSVDHIIPLCKGGMNDLDNLQFTCKSCNSVKGINII